MSALLLIAVITALLVLRQPLMIILLVGIAFIHIVWGDGELIYIAEDMWASLNKELILAIPMFLLCGAVMTKGSSARRLVRIVQSMTRSFRGGLGVATILSCGVFSAISGSSIVTMIAVGGVLYPAMTAAGYSRSYALGSVMAGGTLGIIIPPSVPLILYGLVTETSIVALFLAGILPGLLLVVILTIHASWANRHLAPEPFDPAELRTALREGFWAALFPFILLGGIYSGLYSPTESAAIALVYALFVEFIIHRDMTLRDYSDVVVDTAKLVGALFPLLAVALSLNLLLTENRVPQQLVELFTAYISSPIGFLIVANLLLLAVGAVMTTNEAILILGPLMLPLAEAYGFSPVHWGIIMIVNLEIGFLTPPVGLNLMVAMVTFKEKFGVLVRAATPFILLLLLGLAIIAFVPWLSMAFIG